MHDGGDPAGLDAVALRDVARVGDGAEVLHVDVRGTWNGLSTHDSRRQLDPIRIPPLPIIPGTKGERARRSRLCPKIRNNCFTALHNSRFVLVLPTTLARPLGHQSRSKYELFWTNSIQGFGTSPLEHTTPIFCNKRSGLSTGAGNITSHGLGEIR